ncbi:MAG: HD domain-containing protein [Thermoguttaceae bacterium]
MNFAEVDLFTVFFRFFALNMYNIHELSGLDSHLGSIRIPPNIDVPLTPRVRHLIDTEAFRRLASITQVGLVSLVYPAARHTRFEHSLGVYRLSLLFLKRLMQDERFSAIVSKHDAEVLIATAILHDIGHWPFCHLIEDIRLDGLPDHESLASDFIRQGEIADLLDQEWGIAPDEIIRLLNGDFTKNEQVGCLLSSILSGPIDIDKMDYLFRDSLHAGVPYGRNLDQSRLIGSLCLNECGDGLAISEKGKTATELMIFARYIMFSEVYWHHAVRAATAMLQRLVFELHRAGQLDFAWLFHTTESDAIAYFCAMGKSTTDRIMPLWSGVNSDQKMNPQISQLASGLFGTKRVLYKRVAQFSILEHPSIYRLLAGKPYKQITEVADKLTDLLLQSTPQNKRQCIPPIPILIDAPPVDKEIEMQIPIWYSRAKKYRKLEDVSPVVRAMANEQFDDYSKRVRVFAHPIVVDLLHNIHDLHEQIEKVCNTVNRTKLDV